jgi:hypothetical protein
MTIAGALTDLVDMHDRQAIGRESVNNVPDTFDTVGIGKIDSDAHIGKTAHRSCTHATDDNGFDCGIMEKLDRHHATACLVPAVGNGCHALDGIPVIKIDYGKNVTVAEMAGTFGVKTAGIIGWNSHTHLYHLVE